MSSITIDVHEITRVEGHGNISVRLRDGEITKLELAIVESPRFFESFILGRQYHEAPQITCRVCGICSIAHTCASIRGIEAAAGIEPSEQTLLLRRLALMGEQIQSHVLHLYFLAVPDYLGVGSVIPLAKTHPDVVKRALRLKKLANDLCAIVAGRHIHPIAMRVGGFSHVPTPDALREIRTRFVEARADLDETAGLFSQLKLPSLRRDTEYVALKSDIEYAFYEGRLASTKNTGTIPLSDYRQFVHESVAPHSTAKHCRSPGSPTYAVGALARFNLNHAQLLPSARKVAEQLGLTAPCSDPFQNNTAQLVETVHCLDMAIELSDELLKRGVRRESCAQPQRFGRGVGAVEAPRGILFHEYALDSRGRIEDANLIIPTGQNLANIEEDMRALVPQMLDAGLEQDDMTARLEMLVRAYDPCISCSTHFLDVKWTQ